MSGIFLRIAIYAFIAGAIYFAIKKIIDDWKGRFREMDDKVRERDQRERKRPDVIELKRDQDGVFRKKDKDQR